MEIKTKLGLKESKHNLSDLHLDSSAKQSKTGDGK